MALEAQLDMGGLLAWVVQADNIEGSLQVDKVLNFWVVQAAADLVAEAKDDGQPSGLDAVEYVWLVVGPGFTTEEPAVQGDFHQVLLMVVCLRHDTNVIR